MIHKPKMKKNTMAKDYSMQYILKLAVWNKKNIPKLKYGYEVYNRFVKT